MKNIPHQINDLGKLHSALQVFRELARAGADLHDDGAVGQAMARRGVYTFRNRTLSLDEALATEAQKPRQSQGTRTFARDIRRFFLLLGYLEAQPNGKVEVSDLGEHLVGVGNDTPEARQIWRTALRTMSVMDEHGNASHPYVILLRLAASREGIDPPRLALALEARDDSDEELRRILNLAASDDWMIALKDAGATGTMIANATKVLPGLARQLNDIQTVAGRVRLSGQRHGFAPDHPAGRSESGTEGVERWRRNHRQVGVDEIARAPVTPADAPDTREYADPRETAEIRRSRSVRHQRLVRDFARALSARGFDLLEDPYDILALRAGTPSVLLEAKTLSGDAADEVARVREALAQIFYYERFDVPAAQRAAGILRVALFERPVRAEHRVFLESLGVLTVWRDGDKFVTSGWCDDQFRRLGLLDDPNPVMRIANPD